MLNEPRGWPRHAVLTGRCKCGRLWTREIDNDGFGHGEGCSDDLCVSTFVPAASLENVIGEALARAAILERELEEVTLRAEIAEIKLSVLADAYSSLWHAVQSITGRFIDRDPVTTTLLPDVRYLYKLIYVLPFIKTSELKDAELRIANSLRISRMEGNG